MTTLARAFALALIPTLLPGIVALGGCAAAAHEQRPSDAPSAGPSPAPAQAHACSVPASTPKGICAGCSVSCSGDQQAACTAGEEWAGSGGSCMKTAVCECR